jgi:hypothetical protein
VGEMRNTYTVQVGKSEGKCPLGRPRHMWEDNEMDPRDIDYEVMDWICLAQDRVLVVRVMNFQVPQK